LSPKGLIFVAGDVTTDRFYVREAPEGRFVAARDSIRAGVLEDQDGGAFLIAEILRNVCKPVPEAPDPLEVLRDIQTYVRNVDLQADVSPVCLEVFRKAESAFSPTAVRYHTVAIETGIDRKERFQQIHELEPFRRTPGDSAELKNAVLRISEDLGSSRPEGSPGNPDASSFVALSSEAKDAHVVVINDTGLGFRDQNSALDCICHVNPPFLIVRHSGHILQGNTWGQILNNRFVLDRKIVVANIDDLESRGIRVSRDLSWERVVEDICYGLWDHGEFGKLKVAKHLIITFGRAGTMYIRRNSEAQPPGPDTSWLDPSMFDVELFFSATDPDRTDVGGQMGRMIGTTSLLTASIAHAISYKMARPKFKESDVPKAIKDAVERAHLAMDILYLRGFGPVEWRPSVQFPSAACGAQLAADVNYSRPDCYDWTTIDQAAILKEIKGRRFARDKASTSRMWSFLDRLDYKQTLLLSNLIVQQGGAEALKLQPHARIGNLIAVDRSEVESYRAILRIMRFYCQKDGAKRPLSLAVFGRPGNGKSFGLEEIVSQVRRETGARLESITFNLSQFPENGKAEQLLKAFHDVRDVSVRGDLPVVFWDEFDVGKYEYLARFLAPMQDGTFVDGATVHPIGRAIFVFVGGVNDSMDQFVRSLYEKETSSASADGDTQLGATVPTETARSRKIPDFVSRLRGFVDVRDLTPDLSLQSPTTVKGNNAVHLIRRAILLRSLIERHYKHLIVKKGDVSRAQIDDSVVRAFLHVSSYVHGARSMEAVLATSQTDLPSLTQSCLPSETLLRMHVDAKDFLGIANGYPPGLLCSIVAHDCFKAVYEACKIVYPDKCPDCAKEDWNWMREGVQDLYSDYMLGWPASSLPQDPASELIIRWSESYSRYYYTSLSSTCWLYHMIQLKNDSGSTLPWHGAKAEWPRVERAANDAVSVLRDFRST